MWRLRWLVIVGLVLMIAVSPNYSYATHKSEKLAWQMIFLSSYPACSNYQYQMLRVYDQIAEKYMEVYKLENSKYNPNCMSASKYSNYQVPEDLDLIILVYDRGLGRNELNANDIGGFYNHVGTDRLKNHTIVFCDCPNFKFSDPTWILTHELSHFILYYKGFGPDVVEDMIHSMDNKYDYCIEGNSYESSCSTIKTRLYLDEFAYAWTVMTPYTPAVNSSSLSNTTNTIADSAYLIDMQREITKWWLSGKIDDADYAKSLGHVIVEKEGEATSTSYFGTSNVVFADGPKGKTSDVTYYDVSSVWTGDQLDTIFGRIPFKADPDTSDISLPEWFKTKVLAWADRQIGDEAFFDAVEDLLKNGNIKPN